MWSSLTVALVPGSGIGGQCLKSVLAWLHAVVGTCSETEVIDISPIRLLRECVSIQDVGVLRPVGNYLCAVVL